MEPMDLIQDPYPVQPSDVGPEFQCAVCEWDLHHGMPREGDSIDLTFSTIFPACKNPGGGALKHLRETHIYPRKVFCPQRGISILRSQAEEVLPFLANRSLLLGVTRD